MEERQGGILRRWEMSPCLPRETWRESADEWERRDRSVLHGRERERVDRCEAGREQGRVDAVNETRRRPRERGAGMDGMA